MQRQSSTAMTTKSKGAHGKARDSEAFSKAAFRLVSAMEEPLSAASHFVHVLSLVSQKDGGDIESVSFVATKAEALINDTQALLRKLFIVFRDSSPR